jgi:CheY-like chemotaxis protein
MPDRSQEGAGRKVLVVDDESATLRVLETALVKRGYEVSTALSAAEALDLIERIHFDMLIADIIMPDIDGFEFLAEVRRRPDTATIPFIFLTGDRTVRSKVRGLELGVDEYITKPCAIDELYARMAAIFRRSDAAAARAAPSGVTAGGWDFSGKLSALPPQELLQSLQVNRKTGVLRVETQFGRGELFFEGGDAVHASFGGIDGEEAVYLLFALEDGTFDFRSGVEPTMRTISTGIPSLLLEGMRRMDETRAILAMRDEALKRAAKK